MSKEKIDIHVGDLICLCENGIIVRELIAENDNINLFLVIEKDFACRWVKLLGVKMTRGINFAENDVVVSRGKK